MVLSRIPEAEDEYTPTPVHRVRAPVIVIDSELGLPSRVIEILNSVCPLSDDTNPCDLRLLVDERRSLVHILQEAEAEEEGAVVDMDLELEPA